MLTKQITSEYIENTMNTRLVSLRIPEEDLGDAEKLATTEKRSRAQILLRWIRSGRKSEFFSMVPQVPAQAFEELDRSIGEPTDLTAVLPSSVAGSRMAQNALAQERQLAKPKMLTLADIAALVKTPKIASGAADLRDGVACGHPGCLSHISHPCEGCGRIGGRSAQRPGLDCGYPNCLSYIDSPCPGCGCMVVAEAEPVPGCAACEKDLRQEKGKWVCREAGCGLEGQEQRVRR